MKYLSFSRFISFLTLHSFSNAFHIPISSRFMNIVASNNVVTSRLSHRHTLASDYVIEVKSTCWKAYPFQGLSVKNEKVCLDVLNEKISEDLRPAFTITGVIHENSTMEIKSDLSSRDDSDAHILAILSRIAAQHFYNEKKFSSDVMVKFSDDMNTEIMNPLSDDGVMILFEKFMGTTRNYELSELVDQNGVAFGAVPRKIVHQLNLLHRGVGVFVTKDRPMSVSGVCDLPDLYTHRRSDTKRIFPSLYDMFIGGISIAREDSRLTAAREVAEELGLKRALLDPTMLSNPLFDCTVCTAYNRCVVRVFYCTFDSTKDVISWQEDEVAWGEFIPYEWIHASANAAIQRQKKSQLSCSKNEPDYQSYCGNPSEITESSMNAWDYVPDGLLVWEAWLEWKKQHLSKV